MARSLCGVPGLINDGSAHSRTGSETTVNQGSKHLTYHTSTIRSCGGSTEWQSEFGISRIDDDVHKCEPIPGKLFTNDARPLSPDWVLSQEGEGGSA